jgi:hypothetical protein
VRARYQQVEAFFLEVAEAAGDRHAADFSAARFGHVGERLGFEALVVLAQDKVDHAADRIGAVGRGSAVFENFDTIDRCHRDRVQVDRRTLHAVGCDTAAVEQHQRAVRPLAAEIGRGRSIVAALGAGRDVGVRCQIIRTVAVDVQRRDNLLGRNKTLFFKLPARDDLDRQRAFLGDPLDRRTRDFDTLHRWLHILRNSGAHYTDQGNQVC